MRPSLAVVALLVTPLLAGCLQDPEDLGAADVADALAAYDTGRGWSTPLSPALYDVLESVKFRVPSFDGVEMSVAVFHPAMDGCDWSAGDLPETCRLPVVMSASPYDLDGIDEVSMRPPLTEWLVPRGYAFVRMSLRGTGESGGCMEYKATKDVDDISSVVDWIVAQPWSNGHVGVAGRSYVGTSAWAAAASGNPAVKTIMPISGAVEADHLYFKNGTHEFRALTPHIPGYWSMYALGAGAGDPTYRVEDWPQNLCPEVAEAHVESMASSATGDASSDYWQSRDLTKPIIENYGGSVWVIHGLEDWNVNPSQVVPFINEMQDAGIPTRAWLGVWGHAYPDRMDEHRNVRWDWADEVVQWFDFHLKGEGATPSYTVEVEDNYFVWREEAAYPPRDATFEEWIVGMDGLGSDAGGTSGLTGTGTLTRASEPLDAALRIAGLPQLHVEVTPVSAGPHHLFAELYDVFPDGRSVRLGWAAINVNQHAGGNEGTGTVAPLETVTAHMEFEPMDALVPVGHRLRLVIHKQGVEDVQPSPDPGPIGVNFGDVSVLRLPIVDRPTIIPTYEPIRVG